MQAVPVPWLLAAALFAAASARPARADFGPPPPKEIDYHCSLVEQCASGVACAYKRHSGEGAECRKDAEARRLEHRCRKGDIDAGFVLYCPRDERGTWKHPPEKHTGLAPSAVEASIAADAAAEAAKNPPPETGMCSLTEQAPGAGWLALTGLLLYTRRRR